jgi:hypothetical protein
MATNQLDFRVKNGLVVGGTASIGGSAVISTTDNTNAALRITQLGTGNALVVEDSTNPDSTPFVIDSTGLTTITSGAVIQGLTVGRGAGNVSSNTAVGCQALFQNTTGVNNTAISRDALQANVTGFNNTAVGYQSSYSRTSGSDNTTLGNYSAYNATTGSGNLILGTFAGFNLTTGSNNTFVGSFVVGSRGSGDAITTGSKNTILGRYNGNQGGLDIRTASNYIVLSDGDGNVRAYWDSTGKLVSTGSSTSTCFSFTNTSATTPSGAGFTFSAAAPNNGTQTFWVGSDNVAYRGGLLSNGGLQNYQSNNSNLSDQREKKEIQLAPNYLDKICQIPVKTFLFNDQTDSDLNLGVIAQDVQAVCPELITESNWAKEGEEPKMRLSIYQTDLQYALMKALQELKAEFDAYKASHP